MTHASARQLELYVLGALEPEATDRLEHHVRICPPCAAALAEEARFEVDLQDLLPRASGVEATLKSKPAHASRVEAAPRSPLHEVERDRERLVLFPVARVRAAASPCPSPQGGEGTGERLPLPKVAQRSTSSAAFAAAIALIVGLWGASVTRLDAGSSAPPVVEPQPMAVLACEPSAEAPMCPSPVLAEEAPFTPSAGLCVAPPGGICRIR
jgi:hypothetical protein